MCAPRYSTSRPGAGETCTSQSKRVSRSAQRGQQQVWCAARQCREARVPPTTARRTLPQATSSSTGAPPGALRRMQSCSRSPVARGPLWGAQPGHSRATIRPYSSRSSSKNAHSSSIMLTLQQHCLTPPPSCARNVVKAALVLGSRSGRLTHHCRVVCCHRCTPPLTVQPHHHQHVRRACSKRQHPQPVTGHNWHCKQNRGDEALRCIQQHTSHQPVSARPPVFPSSHIRARP